MRFRWARSPQWPVRSLKIAVWSDLSRRLIGSLRWIVVPGRIPPCSSLLVAEQGFGLLVDVDRDQNDVLACFLGLYTYTIYTNFRSNGTFASGLVDIFILVHSWCVSRSKGSSFLSLEWEYA